VVIGGVDGRPVAVDAAIARGRPSFAGRFGFDGIVPACTPSVAAGSPGRRGPGVVSGSPVAVVARGGADDVQDVSVGGWPPLRGTIGRPAAGPGLVRAELIGSDSPLRLATGSPPSLRAVKHPVAKPLQKLLHMRPAGAMLPICPHFEWQADA